MARARRNSAEPLLCLLLCLALPFLSSGKAKGARHSAKPQPTQSQQDIAEAEAAIDRKDFDAARKTLEQATARDPQNARAWFDLGFVQTALQQPADAATSYAKAAELEPTMFEARMNQGLALKSLGRNDEAIAAFSAATSLHPQSNAEQQLTNAWRELGQLQLEKNPAAAKVSFSKAVALSPKHVSLHLLAASAALRSSDHNAALAEYDAALALQPENLEALAGEANIYHAQHDAAKEEAVLSKLIAVSPSGQKAKAQLQLAELLHQQRRNDEAMQLLQSAIAASPSDASLLANLAALQAEALHNDLAEQTIAKAELLAPKDWKLRQQRGLLLLQLKRFKEAEGEFISALNLDRAQPDLYGNLATAANETKNYPLVIKALDARLKIAPDTPGTYFLRAVAYDNLRAYPEAVNNYKSFLAAASGRFPDQEWQARHRLVTLEAGKKK